jgi:Sulfotransferase family
VTDATPAPFPFVVGCNRSGTTLLRAMLDSHPDLAVPPEAYFTIAALRGPAAGTTFDAAARVAEITADRSFANWDLPVNALDPLRDSPPTDAADVVRGVYAAYARHHSKPRTGDKTPRNVLHIDAIAGALPEARFVHLVRDGRDVVPSVREHLLGPESLPAAIDYWRDRVGAGRRVGATIGTERYLEVRYEDLVADPEPVLRTICSFVDITYTEVMFSYATRAEHVIAGVWDPRNHEGVTRPPTTGVRDWRTTMPRSDLQLFDALAGDLLDELDYGRSGLPRSPNARARAVAWRGSAPLRRAVRPLTRRLARRRRKRRRTQDAGAPPRKNAMNPSGSENSEPRNRA